MYRIFNIAIPSDGRVEEEMNAFLASHRIVSMRTQWVTSGDTPYQVFTVEYLGAAQTTGLAVAASSESKGGVAPRVDYREILSPHHFSIYCRLREERKKIATEEAVRAFVIFTNEQLAAIATLENPSMAAMRKIDGIGPARVEKYGERILSAMKEAEGDGGSPEAKAAEPSQTTSEALLPLGETEGKA